jgi:heme-degrading monooxygenase HmoA
MQELALGQFGCLEFQAVCEGKDEIAVSYWPGEESIRDWKSRPEHTLAQQASRERWCESCSVEVAQVTRWYQVATLPTPQRTILADDCRARIVDLPGMPAP